MPFINIKGQNSYYEEKIGSKLTVVFVHGAGCSSGYWVEQLSALEEYRGLMVDLPGHGKSEGQLLATVREIANWLIEFADALGVERFVLAGHSMGGAVVIETALLYPERLQGLILVASGARLKVDPELLGRLAKGERPFQNANHMFGSLASPEILGKISEEQNQVPPEVFYADFIACNSFDRIGDLHLIKTPCLIIAGEEDVVTPVKYSQFLHAKLINSDLEILKGTGHMCMLEQVDRVNSLILVFLTELQKM